MNWRCILLILIPAPILIAMTVSIAVSYLQAKRDLDVRWTTSSAVVNKVGSSNLSPLLIANSVTKFFASSYSACERLLEGLPDMRICCARILTISRRLAGQMFWRAYVHA